ncbi:hypothetical protein [Jatrophihabitans fulvus]
MSSSDRLVRLTHGVHRSPLQASDDVGRIAALLSACPPGTVVAGESAARLHGMWLPGEPDVRLEVVLHPTRGLPAERPHSRRDEIRCRRLVVPSADVVEVEGLAVTSPARTWLDLAARYRRGDLVALGDSALRAGATHADIAEVVARARRRPGVVAARQVVHCLDGRARSRPESHLRWVLLDAGFPRPEVNRAVNDEFGQWMFEPDLGFDEVQLAVEYQGAVHETDDQRPKDLTRATDVESRSNWRVLFVDKRQVFRQPDVVVRRVKQLWWEQARSLRSSGAVWA